MDAFTYMDLKERVVAAGFGHEVDWSEELQPCLAPCHFVREYIFVVCNSGMKAQVARRIFQGIMYVVAQGRHPITRAFKHPGKAAAIERALEEGLEWWDVYLAGETDEARLSYLETLPWIGPVTKWHLAKNLGMDCAKPDRHLVRIAGGERESHALCKRLAEATGDRVATVDLVIWRAANQGWI